MSRSRTDSMVMRASQRTTYVGKTCPLIYLHADVLRRSSNIQDYSTKDSNSQSMLPRCALLRYICIQNINLPSLFSALPASLKERTNLRIVQSGRFQKPPPASSFLPGFGFWSVLLHQKTPTGASAQTLLRFRRRQRLSSPSQSVTLRQFGNVSLACDACCSR